MTHSTTAIVGWDIGGANTKAARVGLGAEGPAVTSALSEPLAMERDSARLVPTLRRLAPGRWVCGVDVDPVVLEHPFLDEAVLCEGTSLPFACGSFDLCVARWVVEHFPDPPSVLAEVARVVRPGGHFVFITSNRWFIIPASLHSSLFKVALPHMASCDTVPRFYRANTRPKLRKILSGGGWTEQYLRFEDLCHAITGDFRRV